MKPQALSSRDRLILALDTHRLDEARKLIEELREFVGVFKAGLQLFCNAGPALFQVMRDEGVPLFFDGKFLDIPNTVARASEAVAAQGVFMFNVHATGGSAMMRAAVEASRKASAVNKSPSPKVLAVTVLTSIGPQLLKDELGVAQSLENQVVHLAQLSRDSGLDGVVASAAEIKALRAACGPDFLIVTPGIRPSWSPDDDQVRVMTPADAFAHGADYIVVGRPITAAPDRKDAARRLLAEVEAALV